MRRLSGLAAVTSAVVLLLAAGAPCRAGAQAGLLAGAARVEVELPAGVPLAGYGGYPRRAWFPDLLGLHAHAFWFQPSRGVRDPFVVRALYLEAKTVRVHWLAVDLVGVDPTLVADLRERLDLPAPSAAQALLVSASHTHSGPGAYAASEFFGFAAVDRPSAAVRGPILAGLVRAARQAEADKGPAAIALGRAEVTGITRSRLDAPLDAELAAVKVLRPGGRPVAVLWNYAIHGTVLSARNMLLSGDVTGRASALVERELGAPALYVNGAVADVSPLGRGAEGVEAGGAALAAGVRRALGRARLDPAPRLAAVGRELALPAPSWRVKSCVGGWLPAALRIPLARALPGRSEVWALAVGPSAWVTVPGELQTSLGMEVKAARGRGPFEGVFVAGLTNDHLGYFLARADYLRPSYIACASLYGERGGEVVRDAAVGALEALRRVVERR